MKERKMSWFEERLPQIVKDATNLAETTAAMKAKNRPQVMFAQDLVLSRTVYFPTNKYKQQNPQKEGLGMVTSEYRYRLINPLGKAEMAKWDKLWTSNNFKAFVNRLKSEAEDRKISQRNAFNAQMNQYLASQSEMGHF